MAWFKKTRKPIAAKRRQGEPRPGGPLGQVSRLRADHLQQGSRRQSERLPEVRAPLPVDRRRASAHAVRRRVDRTRSRSRLDRSAAVHRHRNPYKSRLKAGFAATGLKDARHRRLRPHRRHRDDRRGAGVRLHRRQHGRRRRREDHARDRARDRRSAARWSSSAARAARA